MAIFQTNLVTLMHQRLQYLSKRSQVLTENIAHADIPGALRHDLKPFRDLVQKRSLDASRNPVTSASLSLDFKQEDTKIHRQEIEKELEILEMNHNALNHQAVMDILSTLHKLYRTALARNG